MRRGRSTRLATVLASAALAACAVAAPTTSKVIGQGVRLKGTNVWYAQGKAVVPKTITASVVSIPAQAVKVQWSVVCQKPNKLDPAVHLAANGKSGESSVHTPATVKLALPYAKPPTCIATVYATLGKSGKLTLRLKQS
jgi:hypothetical protein